jgi:N-acetylmuramoyl-L-alanine amidase
MAEKIYKVGLDAGHGLKTAGKQTPDGIKEWSINDKVRDKVVSFLSGYNVEFIHTDNDEGNADESLASRLNKYLNAGVDCFVSIHHNAFTGNWNGATGVEVYTDRNPIAEDVRLANCIYNRLVANTGMKGRGVKKENWYVINQNRVPAVLVEGGFMDGTNDYKYIISDAGQTAYAKAVADGLIEFLGLTKKAEAPTPAVTPSTFKPYMIKVDKVKKGDVLNIRKEPNANAVKTGALAYNDPRSYTIVEEKNGWGRLLSGVGWINLYYTKKVTAKAEAPKPSIYYPKYTGLSYGIDTVFKAIGVPENLRGKPANRRPIASKNGIVNYTGRIDQNLKLIALAKKGTLKRV